jgi:hypothetical protein
VAAALTPHALGTLRGVFEGRVAALAQSFDALPLARHHEALRACTVQSLERRGRQALQSLPAPRASLRLAGVIA